MAFIAKCNSILVRNRTVGDLKEEKKAERLFSTRKYKLSIFADLPLIPYSRLSESVLGMNIVSQ